MGLVAFSPRLLASERVAVCEVLGRQTGPGVGGPAGWLRGSSQSWVFRPEFEFWLCFLARKSCKGIMTVTYLRSLLRRLKEATYKQCFTFLLPHPGERRACWAEAVRLRRSLPREGVWACP